MACMIDMFNTDTYSEYLLEEEFKNSNTHLALEKDPLVKMEEGLYVDKSMIDRLEDELDRVYHDSITRWIQIVNLEKQNHMLKAQIVELERQLYRRTYNQE
jgi:hypothetical protein